MDLSQGKFVDDTQETILVKDKAINGYGSDTPHVAKLRYGASDEASTYKRQEEQTNLFLDSLKGAVRTATFGMGDKEFSANVATAGLSTATSMFYGAEMVGASVPTFIKNVGLGYKYYADLLFKSEEERNSPEYMAQWAERQKTEEAVLGAVQEIHKRSEEVANKIGEALGAGQDSIGAFVGQTTGSVLTSLGICYLTKNPTLTAAAFALPAYENVLGTATENGKDLTASTGVALSVGTATGILERWGLQNFIEGITTKTLKGAITKVSTTEMVEELSQQAVEDAALIFWSKDKKFVNEDGKINWGALLFDLGASAFGGALGGALGAGGGVMLAQREMNNRRNNTIEQLTKGEKYTRGEAETIVTYLESGEDAARKKYDETYVQGVGEQKSYDDFIKSVPEITKAKEVFDEASKQASDPVQAQGVVSETLNEILDPANLPKESLDEYAKQVKDNKERIDSEAIAKAEEERKKYDVRDIVQEKGADKRSIEATKEAVQAFAESEAEEFGLTPREVVEGKTITLANLTDNSGLSSEEKQQILKQSGLANEETVVAKENGQAPTQEEMDEAYAMMDAEQDKGYIPNLYMQSEQDVKDFYATHNVDRGGLRDALRLGGFAMPSFAVRRIGHETSNQFGEITLVGNKNLASPSRSVEVYDRDAWSPSIAQALNYELTPKANSFIKGILKKHNREIEFSTFAYNIEQNIKSPSSNSMAMDLYALDKGLSEERSEHSRLWKDQDYLDWYEENIFKNAEPYLFTENDANTDMIKRKFTLQNMMKYLRKQERTGGGFIGDFPDAGRLLQYFAYKFPSLKEMKKRKENITTREEQYQKTRKLDEEFYALAEEIKKDGQEYDFYEGGRELAYALVTNGSIKESLERGKMKTDDETIKKIESFKEKLKSVATDYFEAKPRRIVGIEEFSGAIMPNTKEYNNIANQLEQRGLSVKRVEKGNAEQQSQALQEIQQEKPGVFFQSAYAGSRVDYDKPSLEAIGSGEGAQVHGWGLYYALSKDVAEGYRKARISNVIKKFEYEGKPITHLRGTQLENATPEMRVASALVFSGVGGEYNVSKHKLDRLKDYYQSFIDNSELFDTEDWKKVGEENKKNLKAAQEFDISKIKDVSEKGQVHEVDIPESPYLLDEQKPFNEQSQFVQEKLNNLAKDFDELNGNKEMQDFLNKENPTGKKIYEFIAQKNSDVPMSEFGIGMYKEADKAASNLLEKYGIKGITYFGQQDGRCFVIFNPDDVKVIQKFYQGEEVQPRAFADVTDASNILVGMLNSADISALPHEMTHVFTNLHVQNCIKYGKFNSIEGIMKYFGVTNPMELIQNRDIQERLARMSIQYVNEGEAPTAGLRRYFEMFKRFGKKLVSGWKEKGLIDEDALPDEVRKFFDSLLGKNKKQKIDYARIAEQKADVIQAIKRIKAGEAVDISGLPISEVRKLMKVMQTRIPRMPQNLKNALIQAGGIDVEFAKNFGFIQSSGEEKNYRLFKRNGAINTEDALVEFLETNGFIPRHEVEDYDDLSSQWERVEQAIENMDNTYRESDMEKVLERESIEEGIAQANDIIRGIGAEDAFEVIEDIDKLKGRVVAEKEYLESLERKVKNLDKDYKKLYDQLLKDQARDFTQETKEQVKQAKDEIKDYRNQVIDFIKKQDLELKDKAKLISVVKRANTKASFEKVINDVKERAATLYRKEQVRRLSDLIQKEVSTKRPALKEQKYAYEENKLFSDLRDWNKLNKSDAGIRYEAMHNDEEFMGNLTREDEIRLLFLEYKAMGADASPQLLNTLLDYIQIAKRVGMESRNEQEYNKAMSLDDTKNEMIKQVEQRKGKPTVYVKWVSNLYSSLYTIFGKDIADKYELETIQNRANIKAEQHIDKVVKEVMALYGSKSKGDFLNVIAELGKKVATITTVSKDIDTPLSKQGVTRELSTLEIMDIYNAIKNEKTRDDYYYWYGKDQIDSILSKLTNKEMLWADMMMKSVDERYAPVNESFVKNYYTDLPKVDNYWMATSEHKETKTVFDVQGDFNQQSPSFLKERVKSRVLPKPTNAYSKYTKHIKGTFWVTEMADKQVELLNAISSLRVKNAIENKLGKDTYSALKRQVESLSFGGLMEDVDFVTGVIDKAINNVVVAKISLGIPVFTGQLSSVGLYAENMGAGEWAVGFAKGLAQPRKTYEFMKANVGDFLMNRFGGGYDETIGSVLREAEEGKGKYSLSPKTKYNVVGALTSFVRTGDIGAIIFGGYPRLKQLLETMPREEAIKQFEMETLRGQQSNVSASKSAFQQRKGMARVFTSFRNFQYQAVRKIVDSVYGYMNGEVSATQAGKTIALYALYSPIAYELFRQLGNMLFVGTDAFKDLAGKLFQAIMMQELSIVPIGNDVVNYGIKKYLGQYAKSGITTVGVDDLFRAIDKSYKEKKDVYDYGEIVSPFIEMMTGFPSQRIISTTKKILENY